MKKFFKYLSISSCMLVIFNISNISNASDIKIYKSKYNTQNNTQKLSDSYIKNIVNQYIDINLYGEIKAQLIYKNNTPDHIIVFLISNKSHKLKIANINISNNISNNISAKNSHNNSQNYNQYKSNLINDYKLTQEDINQKPNNINSDDLICPDTSIQFISIAPNNDKFEQGEAKKAGYYAADYGYQTALLLGDQATSDAWMNYMSCPKLIGNFYDGDASTQIIITSDGYLTSDDFAITLRGKFRAKVTNIWVACEAFNDPMKSAVMNDANSQKYAAGLNDLHVGPSDETAMNLKK